MSTTTNYPDLYKFHEDSNKTNNSLTTDALPPTPLYPDLQEPIKYDYPGTDLYKQYAPLGECILVDDIQELAHGVVLYDDMKNKKKSEPASAESSKNERTFPQTRNTVERIYVMSDFDFGMWSMMEMFGAMNRQPQNITNITINNIAGSTSTNTSLQIRKKIAKIDEQIQQKEKELSQLRYNLFKITDLQNEIDELKQKRKHLQKKLEESQTKQQDKDDNSGLRLLIAGLSVVALPLLGYFTGKQLADILFFTSMRRKAKKCSKLLKKVETQQNGSINPHWKQAASVTYSWLRASSKLLMHSSIAFTAKITMISGSLAGMFGWYKSNNSLSFTGGLVALVGLSTLLLESARFKSFEQEETNRHIKVAADSSRQLLTTVEPFAFRPAFSTNPQSV